MRLRSDEYLKLTTLDDYNGRVLDIRVWKRTATGGCPTKKSIVVGKQFIVPLIRGLQKIHQEESSIAAHNTTEVTKG